jgi:GNAT superfamily N-acetyltransferase
MCDEWMPTIKLELTKDQFHQLPRNSAFRYEYLEGRAYLSPRPRHYHAWLDFSSPLPEAGPPCLPCTLATVSDGHWQSLELLFAAAFRVIQPFGSLEEKVLRQAAHECLNRTRTGNDGPLIAPASFVASQEERLVGAALVTLVPSGDPCDSSSYRWQEAPPPDCVTQRLGRAHLTWIFVAPLLAGRGIGSALLNAVVGSLRSLGFAELFSTFVLGNDSSMLWHWRHGFRLLAYPGSARLIHQRRER